MYTIQPLGSRGIPWQHKQRMKKPIILHYVTQLCKAVVSLFVRLTGRKESGAKMGLKLLKGGSEIDGRFVNFSKHTKKRKFNDSEISALHNVGLSQGSKISQPQNQLLQSLGL